MADPTNVVINGMNLLTDTNSVDVLTPATSLVNQLLDVSPPVAMALVLSCLYAFTIAYTRVNKLVLDLVVVAGASALYPQLADPGKVGFAVHNPVMAEVVTGALIGCAAIIFNPAIRRVLAKLGALNGASTPEPQPKDPNATSPPNPPSVPPAAGQ
jgi:hypothetical protein